MVNFFKKYIVYIAWFQALIATLGSLYFSEIAHFTPCTLCWYQRIFMYPQVIILAVGILDNNKRIYKYILPLSLIGGAIAFYHNLLYYRIFPENLTPCTTGVPCTTKFFAWFGFITIPLLSLTAFTVISLCMLIFIRINSKK